MRNVGEKVGKGLGGFAIALVLIVWGLRGCGLSEGGTPTVQFSMQGGAELDADTARLTGMLKDRCKGPDSWLAKLLGIDGPSAVTVAIHGPVKSGRITFNCKTGKPIGDS